MAYLLSVSRQNHPFASRRNDSSVYGAILSFVDRVWLSVDLVLVDIQEEVVVLRHLFLVVEEDQSPNQEAVVG